MFHCSVLLLWLQLASAQIQSTASGVIAKPGCRYLCGKVSIPYPFGIGPGCFIESGFEITCKNGGPMKGFLNVTNISVLNGEMTVEAPIATSCSDSDLDYNSNYYFAGFTISSTKNKLISIGCDSSAHIFGYPSIGLQGCSDCTKNEDVTDGSCNGMGCCETSIPAGLTLTNVTAERHTRKDLSTNNPCSYAFIAEDSWFNFSSSYLQDFKNKGTGSVPLVLDWTIGSGTCTEAACGPNAVCKSGNNMAPGYRCDCKSGYAGNPYLDTTTGGHCQEISNCNDNSALGCSPRSESFSPSKVNKIIAGTCLSLSLLLVTSFILGI
ncbi:wall-associated receptor kinase 2-like [Papaver somniferum]|uniref:wall-associated receptor kinase 2-like n=1 Tax=Papaver somniferum TaxID=3469 RepID=UPI000E7060C7|nr:wall-associated receptor kinase 2-like [Papaver somniferum]XP_026438799.1 wall-associated receptor kinase 2-like [Papaver somniferum]XP_026438800.1 wall-associated receptor kinase 2-like [Papaver somniferum]XP_026438801.1 wall-associated receptor kinase 2-like [Papaver somniferum]